MFGSAKVASFILTLGIENVPPYNSNTFFLNQKESDQLTSETVIPISMRVAARHLDRFMGSNLYKAFSGRQ